MNINIVDNNLIIVTENTVLIYTINIDKDYKVSVDQVFKAGEDRSVTLESITPIVMDMIEDGEFDKIGDTEWYLNMNPGDSIEPEGGRRGGEGESKGEVIAEVISFLKNKDILQSFLNDTFHGGVDVKRIRDILDFINPDRVFERDVILFYSKQISNISWGDVDKQWKEERRSHEQ